MQVEQSIFTSLRTSKVQGYHLAAKSGRVNERMSQKLTVWSPSHGGLVSSDASATSINFHPLAGECYAIARSMNGGPEYSDRGGHQLITRSVIIRREQLESYEFNPVPLVRQALALGHLRLPGTIKPKLPQIELNDYSSTRTRSESVTNLEIVTATLNDDHRIAIIGESNPLELLNLIFESTPESRRLEMSFATGLKMSMNRPFRIHFLPACDPVQHSKITHHGIRVLQSPTLQSAVTV